MDVKRERNKIVKRRWRARNPEKAKAQNYITSQIEAGKLKLPKRCEKCNKKGKVEAHHEDYNKPKKIQWLCRKCHWDIHKPAFSNGKHKPAPYFFFEVERELSSSARIEALKNMSEILKIHRIGSYVGLSGTTIGNIMNRRRKQFKKETVDKTIIGIHMALDELIYQINIADGKPKRRRKS